jgi:hypothetical protein
MVTLHASFHFMSDHSIFTILTYVCKKIHTCFRDIEINKVEYHLIFLCFHIIAMSRDSIVGIANGYRLEDQRVRV